MSAAVPLRQLHRLAAQASLASAPDAELLQRFNNVHDSDAFAAIVERYGPMVLNLSRRLTADVHAADDAFQATFLALARAADSIHRPGSLPAWLHATARRFALRLRAANSHRPVGQLRDEPGPSPDPLDEVSARELLQILDEELARLPERYRLPIVLCAIEGLTISEAAQRLCMPTATVRGRLERGRAKLHARLLKRGFGVLAALTALIALPRVAPSASLVESTVQLLSGPIPPAVDVLVGSGGLGLKLKLACAVLLATSIVGIGAAVLPGSGPRPAAKDERKEQPSRLEAKVENDPAARQALRRFGTLQMRDCFGPIAFSPDGQYVACITTPKDPHVTLWDIRTGQEARAFKVDAAVMAIAFSPDSKRVTSSGHGWRTNPVWNVQTARQLFTTPDEWLVFSPDGKRLIGPGPGAINLRDAVDGRLLKEYPLAKDVRPLAVSPLGDTFVRAAMQTDDDASVLKMLKLSDGSKIADLKLGGVLKGVTYSADGSIVAAATGSSIHVWDGKTGKELARFDQRSDSAPSISADGKRVAWSGFCDQNGIAYGWVVDVPNGKPHRIGLSTNSFAAPALSADGKSLGLLDDGGALMLRDVATGQELNPVAGHTGRVQGINFALDGRYLVSRDKNRLLVWERDTGKLIRRYPDDLPDGERQLPYGTPSKLILTAAADGTLRLRDVVTGREVLKLEGKDGWVGGVADPVSVSKDGSAAALVSKDYNVRVYDLTTGKLRSTFDPDAPVWSVHLSSDGAYLMAICQGRKKGDRVTVETRTGKEVDVSKFPHPLAMMIERPDGRMLTAGESAAEWLKARKLLNDDGTPLRTGWNFAGSTVYLPRDGRLIAVRYLDTPNPRRIDLEKQPPIRVRIWDATTKKPLAHFTPQARVEEEAIFSPDGRTFVTTTLEGGIQFWEVATGQERLRLSGHIAGEVTELAFTPNGRSLASGGADTQVLLWDVTGRAANGVWGQSKLSAERRRELWNGLAEQDATKAYCVIWELASDPAGTVQFLAEHVRPVKPVDPELVGRMIAGLDDISFPVRERAATELALHFEAALPAMRKALMKPQSAEQERRLKMLVEPFATTSLTGDRLRTERAAEVLEQIGTAEAKKLLSSWAGGIPEARLTQEAKASLGRLR